MNRSLPALVDLYIHYLRQAGYCHRVICSNRRQLDRFNGWALSCNVRRSGELTFERIEGYREFLCRDATDGNGRPLNRMIQRESWTKLRRFLHWIHREGFIDTNLSARLSASATRSLRRA